MCLGGGLGGGVPSHRIKRSQMCSSQQTTFKVVFKMMFKALSVFLSGVQLNFSLLCSC